jgi:hypothetical protein
LDAEGVGLDWDHGSRAIGEGRDEGVRRRDRKAGEHLADGCVVDHGDDKKFNDILLHESDVMPQPQDLTEQNQTQRRERRGRGGGRGKGGGDKTSQLAVFLK